MTPEMPFQPSRQDGPPSEPTPPLGTANEVSFRSLAELCPDAILVHVDGRVVYANPAAVQLLGAVDVSELLGRSPLDVIAPEYHDLVRQDMRRMQEIGRPADRIAYRWQRLDGTPVEVEVSAGPVLWQGQPGLQVIARDISKQRRAEEQLRLNVVRNEFLLRLSDSLRQLIEPVDILNRTCQLLGEHLDVQRVGYAEIEGEYARLLGMYHNGLPTFPQTFPYRAFGESLTAAMERGETTAVADVATEARLTPEERAHWLAVGVSACLMVGLIRADRWFAALGCHSVNPRAWTVEEISLVEEVGERTWEAVERARVEMALRQSEESLRLATTSTGVCVWEFDVVNQRANWSDELRALFGLPLGMEIKREHLASRIPPDEFQAVEQAIDRVLQPDAPRTFQLQHQIHLPDGQHRYVELRGRSEMVASGTSLVPLRVCGTVLDITERVRADKQLREKQRFIESVLATLPSTLYIFDIQKNCNIFASPQSTDLGYSVEDYQRMGDGLVAELLHPDDFEKVAAFLQGWAHTADEEIREAEYRFRRKDGSYVWRALREKVFSRDADGRVQLVLGSSQDIHERKLTELALRESEESLRQFFETVIVGMAQVGPDARFLRVNQRFCEITGYDRDELLGKMTPFDLDHPEDLARDRGGFTPLLQGLTESYQIEKRYQRKDGTVVWVHVSASVVRNDQGQFRRTAAVIQDITARKSAEDALRQSEQRFQSLAQLAPVGIIRMDAEGKTIYTNQQTLHIVGAPQAQLEGDGWLAFIHEDDRARIAAEVERAVRLGEPARAEYRYRRPNGRILWLLGQLAPEKDVSGKVLGFIATITDISAQKEAEELLRRLNEELEHEVAKRTTELRERETLLRLALDAASAGVWVWYPQTNQVDWDSHYERLFDLPKNGPRSFDVSMDLMHPGQRQQLLERFQTILQTPGDDDWNMECRLELKNQGTRWMHSLGRAERDADGQVVRIIGLNLDITPRKLIEETLRKQQAQLRAILDTVFSAIITIDHHGTIQSVNRTAEKMFGFPVAEMLGQNVKMLMPSPYFEEHDRYLERARTTGSTRVMGTILELQAKRKDGSLFDVALAISAEPDLEIYIGVLLDVSRLKALEREVVEIATLEQRRIGMDLHDDIGQDLTALGLLANSLIATLSQEAPRTHALANQMEAQILDTLRKVRSLARGLTMAEVNAEELPRALVELTGRLGETSGIRCVLRLDADPTAISSFVATQLYHVAQEACTNVLKHAKATQLEVSLQTIGDAIRLQICDNGLGIADAAEGLGMRIMRNRARAIGARFTVETTQQQGTTISCTLNRDEMDERERRSASAHPDR